MARSEFKKAEALKFIQEWDKIVKLLKKSDKDLSKIKLISEVSWRV